MAPQGATVKVVCNWETDKVVCNSRNGHRTTESSAYGSSI